MLHFTARHETLSSTQPTFLVSSAQSQMCVSEFKFNVKYCTYKASVFVSEQHVSTECLFYMVSYMNWLLDCHWLLMSPPVSMVLHVCLCVQSNHVPWELVEETEDTHEPLSMLAGASISFHLSTVLAFSLKRPIQPVRTEVYNST